MPHCGRFITTSSVETKSNVSFIIFGDAKIIKAPSVHCPYNNVIGNLGLHPKPSLG